MLTTEIRCSLFLLAAANFFYFCCACASHTELNEKAEPGVQYKLIYAGRHGEGHHNVANDKYGPMWDEKWSHLFGDGTLIWGPDPELTSLGIQQAQAINDEWKRLLVPENLDQPPLPTRLVSSPFRRSAVTLLTAWDHVLSLPTPLHKPVIRELWREQIWSHTCDWRSSKSETQRRLPEFEVEESMTEKDELRLNVLETEDNVYIRIRSALSQTFEEFPDDPVIGISSHSGAIRALFMAVGHNVFKPRICSFVPMIVKATPVE